MQRSPFSSCYSQQLVFAQRTPDLLWVQVGQQIKAGHISNDRSRFKRRPCSTFEILPGLREGSIILKPSSNQCDKLRQGTIPGNFSCFPLLPCPPPTSCILLLNILAMFKISLTQKRLVAVSYLCAFKTFTLPPYRGFLTVSILTLLSYDQKIVLSLHRHTWKHILMHAGQKIIKNHLWMVIL